jgi:opacity protein-like surface antigen
MKTLIALLAAAAFMAPAFAADAPAVPMTKADCDKTLDMKWDPATKACLQNSAAIGASNGTGSKTSDRTPSNATPDNTRQRPDASFYVRGFGK